MISPTNHPPLECVNRKRKEEIERLRTIDSREYRRDEQQLKKRSTNKQASEQEARETQQINDDNCVRMQ